MRFEIREIDAGWIVTGNTDWHGNFEFYRKTFTEALRRIAEMKKITIKRTRT